ncbi:hypothetical protein N7489_000984 [Penicillium chrysogenum]|uniref:Uncharacterized protein n=1 Tax=Penicillium chrysogenum TaxID=5076 RepID=A0ABQ8WHS3_PENCH|nr:uncharacterized protein N7489_000984 [Penicillium chrysogenum]XP_061068370.1 uncharacterized protein N7525_007200 [Penicillium rubens]KAJ5250574.1 hypothetical protein N7489_000984 [Penicillium chrysogenum]KAJ5266185.1 hypothetical protein N7524_007203 [Penicillium chrysogenum]KAJ5269473.1 hypothetical protein N7505_005231 [Penicillium chrysogenum]KAJ5828947.1 hypothetical protein N7525_007200 [Penicillium rubens]KAJ5841353.1 hypothetical protein N7534_011183 [Penicillium rubens]
MAPESHKVRYQCSTADDAHVLFQMQPRDGSQQPDSVAQHASYPPNAAQKGNPMTNITCRLKLETQGRTQEMHTAE